MIARLTMCIGALRFHQLLFWTITTAGWAVLLSQLPTATGAWYAPLVILLVVAAAWANYLRIEVEPVKVNQAFAFELLAVLMLDPIRAAVIGIVAYIAGQGIPQRHELWRLLVNGAVIGLSVLAMGHTYQILAVRHPLVPGMGMEPVTVLNIIAASLTHFVVNSLLVYSILLARPNRPNVRVIGITMGWDLTAKFVFAPLAYYIALGYGTANPHDLVGPLLFMLFIWLVLKNSMELTQTRTELKSSVENLNGLHQMSKAIYSSLDLREVLDLALVHCTRLIEADHGAMYLSDRATRSGYLAHVRSGRLQWTDYLYTPEAEGLVGAIFDTRCERPPEVSHLKANIYLLHPTDPLARELGIGQLIALALLDKTTVVGALVFGLNNTRTVDDTRLETMGIIRWEVIQAINNASLHDSLKREIDKRRDELALAEKIQKRMLPPSFVMPGVKVETHFRPARSVGGDYYDLIKIDDSRLAVVIGDVSGKGVPAALTMMSVINRLKVWTTNYRSPERVLDLLNQSLVEPHRAFDEVLQYSTAIFGVFDTRTRIFTYSMAGHERPLLVHPGEPEPAVLDGEGYPLGLFAESAYTACTVRVEPGDKLILFTDGIPDMQNLEGDRLTRDGFYTIIAAVHEEDPEEFAHTLFARLKAWGGSPEGLADDQAIVVLEVTKDLPPEVHVGMRDPAYAAHQSRLDTA